MSENPCRETPSVCPYCGAGGIGHIPDHIRKCDAVPSTEEVVGR